jgi:hypothetical protein
MCYNVSLFVDTASSLEEFADEVRSLLDIALQRVDRDGAVSYEYSRPDFTLDLFADHGMVNDRDMKFEDYRYQLSFSVTTRLIVRKLRTKTLRFARLAFERLKNTRRYSMMLVENTQRKLDSFELAA